MAILAELIRKHMYIVRAVLQEHKPGGKNHNQKNHGNDDEGEIMGRSWGQIKAMQQGTYKSETTDLKTPGDYGADPIGDGKFRMVPSGDIVDYKERTRRLDLRKKK